MYKTKNNNAFTLVELIVVIVILAILATIAFLSFSLQSASARDSTRLTDISNISKGLGVFNAVAGKLPMPDDAITISASGTVIRYQGYAGSSVLNMIKISNGGKDPLYNSSYYTYATNAGQNKVQILGFLEDGSNSALSMSPGFFSKPGLESTYADPSSYSGRFAMTKGDGLGILLDGSTLVPVQASNSNIDLVTTDSGTSYKAVFGSENSGNNVTASGNLALSNIITRSSDLLQNKAFASMDNSLVGYWDMETTALSGSQIILKDLSKYGNNGACRSSFTTVNCGELGPQIIDGNGKSGKALYFSGNINGTNGTLGDSIAFANVADLANGFTVTYLINNNYITGDRFVVEKKTGKPVFGTNSGRVQVILRDESNTTWQYYSNTTDLIKANKWYYISATFDNEHNIKLYKNGVKIYQGNHGGKIGGINENILNIGGRDTSQFNGIIDEVRIYNRHLSENEISTLYNSLNN